MRRACRVTTTLLRATMGGRGIPVGVVVAVGGAKGSSAAAAAQPELKSQVGNRHWMISH